MYTNKIYGCHSSAIQTQICTINVLDTSTTDNHGLKVHKIIFPVRHFSVERCLLHHQKSNSL